MRAQSPTSPPLDSFHETQKRRRRDFGFDEQYGVQIRSLTAWTQGCCRIDLGRPQDPQAGVR
jgi:hypothetical protein